MAVHLSGPVEEGLERGPTERKRGCQTYRAPQRIAPTDTLSELEDARFVDALIERRLGRGSNRDDPAVRVFYPGLAKPRARRFEVGQSLERGERLGRNHHQSRRRIERLHCIVEGRTVDIGE